MSKGGGRTVKPHRQRHDGFTPKKQRRFFKALGKTGCLSDAARRAGISRNTVRRHRLKWPDFEVKVQAALAMAGTELETIAWQRAVEGVPEVVIREGKVAWIKIKPSDAILRLLLQGANPRKYGRTGNAGAPQGKPPPVATNAEVREALAGRLRAFRARVRAEKRCLGGDSESSSPSTAVRGLRDSPAFAMTGSIVPARPTGCGASRYPAIRGIVLAHYARASVARDDATALLSRDVDQAPLRGPVGRRTPSPGIALRAMPGRLRSTAAGGC